MTCAGIVHMRYWNLRFLSAHEALVSLKEINFDEKSRGATEDNLLVRLGRNSRSSLFFKVTFSGRGRQSTFVATDSSSVIAICRVARG